MMRGISIAFAQEDLKMRKNHTDDQEETDSKIVDAGEYLEDLKNEMNNVDWLFKGLPPKLNYGKKIKKKELERNLLKGIEKHITFNSNPCVEYIEKHDIIVISATYMSRDEFFEGDPGTGTDKIVVQECPVCGAEHDHPVKPRIALGGISKYRCPCLSQIRLVNYHLKLADYGPRIHSEHIHSARQELLEEYRECESMFLPEDMDHKKGYREVLDWD